MKRKLVIYLPSLAAGGAERVHINLAPALIEAGYDVAFLLQRDEGELQDCVPEGVRVIALECARTISSFIPLVFFLRREKPDIIIANMGHTNIAAILAARIARVPTRVIATYHNTLSAESAHQRGWKFRILPVLTRIFLRFADGIIAVSKGVADDLVKVTKLPRERITVIYNPVICDDFDEKVQEQVLHPWLAEKTPFILGLGRLTAQKDFATLIRAFAIVAQSSNVRLMILGEGPERGMLEKLVQSLGMAERVSLPGFQSNPLPFMRASAAFVLSSLYEGLGNVLIESLACGTPVISTDCPHGPVEILAAGRYGTLVPTGDETVMAEAISATLKAPRDSQRLQMRGREFTVWRAADGYQKLLDEVLGSHANADGKDKKIKVLIKLLIDILGRDIGDILVVGCGTGREAGMLAYAFGANVVGIDTQSDGFDNEAAFPARLQQMDACALNFPESSFDLVFSFHALEHIASPEAALKEMARVLRPGGSFLVGTPNKTRLIGYIGSAAPLTKKVAWNIKDMAARIAGKWSNEAGAHAGFSSVELTRLCAGAFGHTIDVSNDYYRRLYAGRAGTISFIIKSRLKTFLFPCVYVAGKRS